MGEYSDLIIYGVVCSDCQGEIDGEKPGFPRLCEDCEKLAEREKAYQKKLLIADKITGKVKK